MTIEAKEMESAVEGILFAAGEPVDIKRICMALDADRSAVEQVLQRLADYYAYERRGIRLLRMEDSWVWCGSVLQGDDGYHMYAARWPKQYPMFVGYLYQSEIVHAYSESMCGPYRFVERVLPTGKNPAAWDGRMAHNPTVVRYGKRCLLYYIGTTYREDSPERPYLKGPLAHNVPLLDGRSSCVPKGSWGYSDFGYPLKTYARHADGVHYFEGALVGHDPLH